MLSVERFPATPCVLLHGLINWRHLQPSAVAWWQLDDETQSATPITWDELVCLIVDFTDWLSSHQVTNRTLVGIHLPNGIEWLIACFAAHALHAVDVPFDYRMRDEQADALAGSIGCTSLIRMVDDEIVMLSPASNRDSSRSSTCWTLRDALRRIHQGQTNRNGDAYHQWELHARKLSPWSLATLLWTSGTTGQPKAVSLTHLNLASNASAKWLAVPQSSSDLRMTVLSFAHAYARTSDIGTWLVSGSQLCAVNHVDEFFHWSRIAAPHLVNTVPFVIQRAANDAGSRAIAEWLGGRLRWLGCGGAPLSQSLFERLTREGVQVIQGYGLTESSPVIASASPNHAVAGCVGPPVAGVEVRIDEQGEVWCRGANVMQGYWQDSTATARRIVNGWLATGDRGTWDASGQLRILGRCDDTITLATGHKVSPAPIERLLLEQPQFEQVMVYGDVQGQLSVLVWSDDESLSEHELARLTSEACQSLYWYEQPKSIQQLPRKLTFQAGELTLKGTIRRAVVQQRYAR